MGGLPVAQWGSLERPQTIRLVEQTTAAPPSLPGQPPPERCRSDAECPPGLPGCAVEGAGWGEACGETRHCKHSLYCKSGLCEPAPECKTDSDCQSEVCSDGYCEMEQASTDEGGATGLKLNWVGLHIGGDIGIVKGDRLCALQGWDQNFRCFRSDDSLVQAPSQERPATTTEPAVPYWSTSVGTTAVFASVRVLLSYDRVVMPNLTVGGRLGIAFGGAPSEFLPYHVEARGAYWLLPLTQPGLKPYVGVAGGMAQVDAEVDAERMLTPSDPRESLRAYKRMGQGFAALCLGAVMPLNPRVGVQANINGMYMFPSTGLVIEPSIGGIVGF
jgi:hypothetical protein